MKGTVMNIIRNIPLTRVLTGVVFLLSSHTAAFGEGLTHQAVQVDEPQKLRLIVGESKIVESGTSFKRASVANPDVADQIVVSPKQVYLAGKGIGTTTLTLWNKQNKVANVFQVEVTPDINRLKEQLHTMLPDEPELKVMSSHDNITLTGSATNMAALSKALAVAEPYAPGKVVNLIQVGGVQQVMMEVKIAEMQRGLLKRIGVNFKRQQKNHRDFTIGLLGGQTNIDVDNSAVLFESQRALTQNGFPATGLTELWRQIPGLTTSAILGFGIGNDLWTVYLDLMKEHGLSKTLAEPTLIAESGQAAEFLAGGEFPIPIPQQFSQVTIKFKEFGVGLKFTPTVLADGRISVIVNPEVSELDFSNGVQLAGFQIPSLITRRVKTVVELGNGQSFAIAGLLQENIRETVSKYPVLGDIPILGALFRSTDFQKNETELIVIVTPHLVKPLNMAKQTLPTDYYLEPNDFELMLMGYVEGVYPETNVAKPEEAYSTKRPKVANRIPYNKGGMEGTFGHLAP